MISDTFFFLNEMIIYVKKIINIWLSGEARTKLSANLYCSVSKKILLITHILH